MENINGETVSVVSEEPKKELPQGMKDAQFQPGQSGNPAGKPKGTRNFKTILEELLAENTEITFDAGQPTERKVVMSKKQALMLKWIETAFGPKGTRALLALVDRIDGKATQPIDLSGDISSEGVEELRKIADSIKQNMPKSDGNSGITPSSS